jgi:hypothetical protein
VNGRESQHCALFRKLSAAPGAASIREAIKAGWDSAYETDQATALPKGAALLAVPRGVRANGAHPGWIYRRGPG